MHTPFPEPALSNRSPGLLGTLINGKWRVERVLGEGGMATVYYAVHEHTRRRAAIKVLHPEFCHAGEVRERFAREARAANSVNHRGAVPVLDDGELPDGTPFLVMDYLEGESVQDRLDSREGGLTVEESLFITEQLLGVLAAAHRAGVLHRDIKPDNIYLTSEGEVKLLDFGISKLSGEQQGHKTQVGSTMGTPAFMAPEQARGRWEEIDARTEVFSVGATMFTLLSGKHIHSAQTSNELLLKVMTQPVPDLRQVAPHVPDDVAEVVHRAVAFEKNDRFETADEMRAAIGALLGDQWRPSQHSFGDDELQRSALPPFVEDRAHRTTYRPVMSSQFSRTTIGRGLRYSPQKWGFGVAMIGAALLSYLLFVNSSADEEQPMSPVTAIQRPAAQDIEALKMEHAPLTDSTEVIDFADLPEDEPDQQTSLSAAEFSRKIQGSTAGTPPNHIDSGQGIAGRAAVGQGVVRQTSRSRSAKVQVSGTGGAPFEPVEETDPLARRR